MPKRTEMTDDQAVHLLVDGELSPGEQRVIEQKLTHSEDLRQLMEEYRGINDQIVSFNRDLLEEPFPARFSVFNRHRNLFGFGAIAASLVLVCAGVIFGWFSLTSTLQKEHLRLINAAVTAHAVYSTDVLHPVEVDGTDTEHLRNWLSKRLGKKIVLPDLQDEGLTLLGGRILPGDDLSPHGQLMYRRRSGERISVYIMNSGDSEHVPTLFTERSNLGVFYWIDEELSCAVVFAMNEKFDYESSLQLSNHIYEQLEL